MLFTILLAAHIVLAILLIGVILIQQGKGATAGAAFGSGASSTVFGARGSASFLTRLTSGLALLFFSNSLLLAYLYGQTVAPQSLLDKVAQSAPPAVSVPAETTPADLPAAIDAAIRQSDVPAAPGTTDSAAAAAGEAPRATVDTPPVQPPAPVDDVPAAPAPAEPAAATDEVPSEP